MVESQFRDLISKYPSLMLRWEGNTGIVEGELSFQASFNEVIIEDTYDIRIEIPPTYPNELPVTKELGKKIPGYFHKNGDDILCLEVYTKILMDFIKNPTLLFYVEKFVIEYLYGFSYKKKFGYLPYGERPHGISGIVDFYKELFKVSDTNSIFEFLKILTNCIYRGHHLCPCNSGRRLRNCHGEVVKRLLGLNISNTFKFDYELLAKKH